MQNTIWKMQNTIQRAKGDNGNGYISKRNYNICIKYSSKYFICIVYGIH